MYIRFIQILFSPSYEHFIIIPLMIERLSSSQFSFYVLLDFPFNKRVESEFFTIFSVEVTKTSIATNCDFLKN